MMEVYSFLILSKNFLQNFHGIKNNKYFVKENKGVVVSTNSPQNSDERW